MAHPEHTTAPTVLHDSASPPALPAPATSDPYGPLDAALDMVPVKGALARRIHGAYTRAVRGALAAAAELELADGAEAQVEHLRRVAASLSIAGAAAVRAAGGGR